MSFRNGKNCWILELEGSFLVLWAFTSGATESVLNKFSFIRLGIGEIFLDEDLKPLQRNGTIAQLSNRERQSLLSYPFVLDVSVNCIE